MGWSAFCFSLEKNVSLRILVEGKHFSFEKNICEEFGARGSAGCP